MLIQKRMREKKGGRIGYFRIVQETKNRDVAEEISL